MFCSNCGRELSDGSRFCDGCGIKVERIDTSSSNDGATEVASSVKKNQSMEINLSENSDKLVSDTKNHTNKTDKKSFFTNVFPRNARDYVGLMNAFVFISNICIILAMLFFPLIKIDYYFDTFESSALLLPWKLIGTIKKISEYMDLSIGGKTGIFVYAISFYFILILLIMSFKEMKKHDFGSFALIGYIAELVILLAGKLYINSLFSQEDALVKTVAEKIFTFESAYGFMIFWCIVGIIGILASKYSAKKKLYLPLYVGVGNSTHSESTNNKDAKKVKTKIIVLTNMSRNEVLKIDHFPSIIGRNRERTDYQLYDISVELLHCEISTNNENFFVKDLNSTSGTKLNNNIILPGRKAEIISGDKITIGTLTFSVHFEYK